MRPVMLLAAAVLAGCGRTELDAPAEGADAGDAAAFAPHPPCASASGVRLCGGPANDPSACPSLPSSSCIGYGCTDLIDFDGNPSTAGVCWADSAETDWRCDGCTIGDGCLQRRPGEWICVPIDVCEALWDLGVQDVCRYADKNRYDHRPIPSGVGCPAPASTSHTTYYACGGDCAPCPSAQRCNGVAPDHPFGVCNRGPGAAYDPSFSCGTSPPCGGFSPDVLCAVPDVPGADVPVAREYGACVDQANCLELGASFPGGLGCYDAQGNRWH